MARSVNKLTLVGNLTADPELRYTGSGTAVVNVGLATNDSYKDASGEYVEKTQFHNLTIWGRLAEIVAEYSRKGQNVYVEGSVNYGSFENNEGITVKTTEVKVREFIMLGGRGSNTGDSQPEADVSDDEEADDDLPF